MSINPASNVVTVFSGRNWKGCIREETDLLVASVVCLPYDSESIAPLTAPQLRSRYLCNRVFDLW